LILGGNGNRWTRAPSPGLHLDEAVQKLEVLGGAERSLPRFNCPDRPYEPRKMRQKGQLANKASLFFQSEQSAPPTPKEMMPTQGAPERSLQRPLVVGRLISSRCNVATKCGEQLPLLLIAEHDGEGTASANGPIGEVQMLKTGKRARLLSFGREAQQEASLLLVRHHPEKVMSACTVEATGVDGTRSQT
jgi:hypothetical protein